MKRNLLLNLNLVWLSELAPLHDGESHEDLAPDGDIAVHGEIAAVHQAQESVLVNLLDSCIFHLIARCLIFCFIRSLNTHTVLIVIDE